VGRTPESEFRTKRTNVFVTGTEAALPFGAWDRVAEPDRLVEGDVIVFVDGSWSGDSTGMVGCTIGERPHLFVVDAWERPDGAVDWRVPINEVKQRCRDACRQLGVRALAFDPYRWQQTMVDLLEDGLPVVEFPTNSVPRIVPAWKHFYDGVMDLALSHDGDPRLARHIENMVLKVDQHGARPVKEHRMSRRHIDLGMCAVGAYDIASSHLDAPAEPSAMFV